MSKNFYYLGAANEVCGPFSVAELNAMKNAGKIMLTTLVCEEGAENWMQFYLLSRPTAPLPKAIKEREERPKEVPRSRPKKKNMRRVGMPSSRKPKKPPMEVNGCLVYFVLFVLCYFFIEIFDGDSSSSSSSSSSEPAKKYCISAGCTNPPSTWYGGESGYCKEHAKQIIKQQELIDKIKNQGY